MVRELRSNLKDGMIEPDSEVGKFFGFTSDKFGGWIWKDKKTICISMIFSLQEGQGNFGTLCKNILSKGYTVQIPTPMGKMEQIVRKNGYKMIVRPFNPPEIMDPVEVWELKP